MIWNEKIETMPRGELEQLQDKRLRSLVKTLAAKVPFYEVNFRENDIDPDTFKGLEELHKLPFTHKSDLRDHYPFGLFAEPMDKVARIHASSGTTGKPTVVGYTKNDLDNWAEVCARSFALSGAKPGQMFQNAYGYGLFTGGLGMHYGAERMGLTVIPVSGGNTARQILLLQDFKPDILACTPSYALSLADRIIEEGIDFSELNLKTLILGAEPWTGNVVQRTKDFVFFF